MKRILYMILIVAGFMILIGTAGGSDAGTMNFGQVIVMSLISVIISVAGLFGLDLEERRERNGTRKNV